MTARERLKKTNPEYLRVLDGVAAEPGHRDELVALVKTYPRDRGLCRSVGGALADQPLEDDQLAAAEIVFQLRNQPDVKKD